MDWRELTNTQFVPRNDYGGADFHLGLITCAYCDTRGSFDKELESQRTQTGGRFVETTWLTLKCQACSNRTFITHGPHSYSGVDYVQFPRPIGASSVNEAVPPVPARFYVQAQENIRTKSWDGAILLARSALQAVTRGFEAQGRNLAAEIDDLAERKLIVASMRDWAHQVREVGNDSAHPRETDTPPTEEDAREIVEFTGLMLHLLYVLPARIEQQKQRRE
ncbi:DUF4145 domain-containing protein [Deinococcus phoenicis]|uniref:DUF4145 domain-containing protein n=1 Tax=Deinococcus phoenicis TaxID=1476583 RepID=UPI001378A45E|nr:DUF4145 domain-containing protein [Deinococcus phoenicis]